MESIEIRQTHKDGKGTDGDHRNKAQLITTEIVFKDGTRTVSESYHPYDFELDPSLWKVSAKVAAQSGDHGPALLTDRTFTFEVNGKKGSILLHRHLPRGATCTVLEERWMVPAVGTHVVEEIAK